MKYRILYGIWAALFALCAGLGFLPTPGGAVRTALTILSVVFFVPGAVILYWANRERNLHQLRVVRNLAFWLLLLTAVLLMANVLSAVGSAALGNALYALLVVMSAPMVCSQVYALSLFLWACLLMTGLYLSRKRA